MASNPYAVGGLAKAREAAKAAAAAAGAQYSSQYLHHGCRTVRWRTWWYGIVTHKNCDWIGSVYAMCFVQRL